MVELEIQVSISLQVSTSIAQNIASNTEQFEINRFIALD